MRYLALATDYDGTIATEGLVDENTRNALIRLKATGRRVLLVTGRSLVDLREVLRDFALFDLMVVENGAVVYDPATQQATVLCAPPPPTLLAELARRGLGRLAIGRAIVATDRRWAPLVDEVISDLGLRLQLIFNRDSVMILPSGVDKATGLRFAATQLRLSLREMVAVGDAENDWPLLEACGMSVAVANAVPALRVRADVITRSERGAGVVELVDWLIASDSPDGPAGVEATRHPSMNGQTSP